MCTHHDDKPVMRTSHVHPCCVTPMTLHWVYRASASTPLLDTMNQPAKSDAYALTATPDTVHDGTIQLPTPPALSMAWHLIPSKHDPRPRPRQRRETPFGLLPSTTRPSLLSCSRRGSIPINCFRRAASTNVVPKSAVFSNV